MLDGRKNKALVITILLLMVIQNGSDDISCKRSIGSQECITAIYAYGEMKVIFSELRNLAASLPKLQPCSFHFYGSWLITIIIFLLFKVSFRMKIYCYLESKDDCPYQTKSNLVISIDYVMRTNILQMDLRIPNKT